MSLLVKSKPVMKLSLNILMFAREEQFLIWDHQDGLFQY